MYHPVFLNGGRTVKQVRMVIQLPEPLKAKLDALGAQGTTASGDGYWSRGHESIHDLSELSRPNGFLYEYCGPGHQGGLA
jgi:hypothetical protein